MEIGVAIYALVVFGGGSALLLGSLVILLREVVLRPDRPSWAKRSQFSKSKIIGAALLIAAVLVVPTSIVWMTRTHAVSGEYQAYGVWGDATLRLLPDGRFEETWRFTNQYSGKAEGSGRIQGRWQDHGRDWLTRDISLIPFAPLLTHEDDFRPRAEVGIVTAYAGRTAIEIESDIDFLK